MRALGSLAVAFAFALPAAPQEPGVALEGAWNASATSLIAPSPEDEDRAWWFEADAYWTTRPDFDDGRGSLGVWRTGSDLGYTFFRGPGSGLKVGVGYEHSNYRFENGSGLGGVRDPFENVVEVSARARYVDFGPDKLDWFAGLGAISGYEYDGDYGDGLYYEGTAGFLFELGDTLKLGVGGFAWSQIEDDDEFLVIPLIDWRFAERWRLGLVDSNDPGFGLTYQFFEEYFAYASAVFERRQYSIESGALPNDSAILDEEYSLRFGTRFRGFAMAWEAFGGVVLRTLTLNADDDKVDDDDVDPGLIFGINFSARF